MHRMQLKLISIAAVVAAVSLVSLLVGPFHFVRESEEGLSPASFGYSFQGAPFSGVIFGYHSTGGLSRLSMVFKGKNHGMDLRWFPNGQRSVERYYRDGLETGTHKTWYEEGKPKSLKTFDSGKAHGEHYEWHPNGQLAQFARFDRGAEVAAKSWTSGGKPFFNYVWKDQARLGLLGDSFCTPAK